MLALASAAKAGESAKCCPLTERFDSELSVGFDTDYYFRGAHLSDSNVWAQVATSAKINEVLTADAFAWYTDSTDDDYTEYNLGLSLTYSHDFADFTLGYVFYDYPNGDTESTNEINATISKEFCFAKTYLMYAYDFDIEGQYLEAGLSKSFELTKSLGLETSAALGYNAGGYTTGDEGLSHLILKAALPVKLSETATLTPYLAVNFALDELDGVNPADEDFFGGVAFAVSF